MPVYFLFLESNASRKVNHSPLKLYSRQQKYKLICRIIVFQVRDNDDADVQISFGTFYHTDIERDPTFDGAGGTLAHAFYPNSGWGDADGDVHLDDSETFTHHEIVRGVPKIGNYN